jgi:hypothetical protein
MHNSINSEVFAEGLPLDEKNGTLLQIPHSQWEWGTSPSRFGIQRPKVPLLTNQLPASRGSSILRLS